MSTQLKERGDHFEVSTVAGLGKRRRIPRGPVRVPKGDKAALVAEMVRQATQARIDFNLNTKTEETVV